MGLLLSYSIRNLYTRKLTTVLTAAGMTLVVFVFAAILMLAQGLQKTLVETGSYDNVIVIRKASSTEVQSGIDRLQAAVIEAEPEVARGADAKLLLAKELLVLVTLPRRNSPKRSNVPVRGIGAGSLALRPQVRLVEGRLPHLGSLEIIAGKSVAERFTGGGLGETLHLGLYNWTIVGIFDAGTTAFNSEVWGDGEQLMQAFRRPVFSSVIFKLRDPSKFEAVRQRLEGDPRLTVDVKQEIRYYLEQSEMMAKFLRVLGISLTIIFSLGATIGAMITMYAAVATRTGEIGTLRALGFRRTSILAAFLFEALFLGLISGCVGLLLASLMQFFTISTLNFQTFSELAFTFVLSPGIALSALSFSVVMGFVGGVLPALRAARMEIVEALRAA
jgi:ABC-type lipoprotein release transport system permease subunit